MPVRDLKREMEDRLKRSHSGSPEALQARMIEEGRIVLPPKPKPVVEDQPQSPLGLNKWGLPMRAMDKRAKDRYTGRGRNLARDHFTPEKYPHLQCKAISKTTGERCRHPAKIGWHLCFNHGANGTRNPDGTVTKGPTRKGENAQRNRAVKAARAQARKKLSGVSGEAFKAFRDYAHTVPESDHERFLILLDVRMQGRMSTPEWSRVLGDYCVL